MTQQKKLTNSEIADIFDRIANLLEIKGEVVFKIRAYQRASENLRVLAEDVNKIHAEGRLKEVPGIGQAIAEKIDEILTTGKLGFLERLEAEVPPSLLELLQVPDVGPKKAALFWKQAGVTNLSELETAVRNGKLKGLPGMGARSEARIIAGIEVLGRRTDRMSLDLAWAHAEQWLAWLREQPEVQRAEVGGSLRRWRETIGDLDLITACEHTEALMDRFIHHPDVVQVLGQGENKSSVELKSGLRIQLWAQPPARFGSLWIYATGSKAHNVRLRELALKKKLSLSERGFTTKDDELIEYDSEEAVYEVLGLPWIPPEMREDRGEIEAALKKKMPQLIETSDIKGELHSHSTWSDGAVSIAEMAQAAVDMGYQYLAITDHSGSLGIAGGLKAEQLPEQRAEIVQVQAKFGSRLRLLHGTEVDIMADGSLAFSDEALAELDIVVASLHSTLRQPRETITERLVRAIRNPHVDIIGHPSGRLLPNREGADLDWEVILNEAKAHGVALEINASPYRLDLNDVYTRRACEMGIPIVINTDAHAPDNLHLIRFGISVARRAWTAPEAVINTWPAEKLLAWLQSRGA